VIAAGATDHLIGMTGIDAEADGHFDALVELGKRHVLHQRDRLLGLIGLRLAAPLTRGAELLSMRLHEAHPFTVMPMERAAPAIIATALSMLSQFRSGIFVVAIFSSCARVIVPTFTLFG